jgi:hypothetical protein
MTLFDPLPPEEKNVTLPCLCGRGEGTPPQKRDLNLARELR